MNTKSLSESTPVHLSIRQFLSFIGLIAAGIISFMLYINRFESQFTKADDELRMEMTRINYKISLINLMILSEDPQSKSAVKQEIIEMERGNTRGGYSKSSQ